MAKKTKKSEAEKFDYESFESEAIQRLRQGDELVGPGGVLTGLLQRIINAALEGELDGQLEEDKASGAPNRRNGFSSKQVRSSLGEVPVKPPRDRLGNFEPQLIGKWQRQLGNGLDEQILGLYARGNSVEDIRRQLQQIYGLEYSSGSISAVTERVWEEVVAWQQRPLKELYSVVYLDALHYKVREDGRVITKAVYIVYGIDAEGERDVLGMYLGKEEGARQWGRILEDIRRRGVQDVLFFCVDGLEGFSEAIWEVFPQSLVQRCIVHMVRTSLRFVADKDRKKVSQSLRQVYTAANEEQAQMALEAFKEQWEKRYPEIAPKWEAAWGELMVFMDYSEHIRRMIYTTNAVEALHRIIRKVTKTKGAWVNDKGLLKQLYLALLYSQKSWQRKAFNWNAIQRELIIQFGERYTRYVPEA